MNRLLWLVLVAGCMDHTYPVGADRVASVQIFFHDGRVDTVTLGFVDPMPTAAGCPVLAADVVVKLGGTPLTGSRGGYNDGKYWDSADQPPSCQETDMQAPMPDPLPATIDLVVEDARTTAHMTVVAPYAERTLATPSALVPGTTARLVWAPATDLFLGASITCDASNAASQQQVVDASTDTIQATGVDVPLTYADGVMTFPVPSQPSYHGALTCYLGINVLAGVTDCSGFTKCEASPDNGPATPFATSI